MKVDVVHFAVSDIRRALDFYVTKLGLPQKRFLPHLKNPWAEFDAGTVTIGVQEVKEKFEGKVPPWRGAMISFEVDDIEAAQAELKKRGVHFVSGIRVFEEVKVARFEDPDGNPLEIHEWL